VGTNLVSPLTAHIAGMVVYNTATAGSGTTAVSPGFYYNNGTEWVRLAAKGDVSLYNMALTSTTSPAGASAGQVVYNTSAASGLPVGPAYWDGAKWVSQVPGTTSTTVLTSASAPAGTSTGQVAYNTGTVQPTGLIYWDGSQWKAVNSANSVVLTSASAPAGSSVGQTMYNTGSVEPTGMVFWDGTQWKSINSSNSVSLTSTTSPAGASTGQVVYNTSAASGLPVGPAYWDGAKWVQVGGGYDLTSISSPLVITNGLGAISKNVNIKLDSNALGHWLTTSPLNDSLALALTKAPAKDSVVKVVTTSSIFRDSVTSTVNNTITSGGISGQNLTSTSGGALVITGGTGTSLKSTSIAVNKDSIVTSAQVANVLNTAPAKDSLLKAFDSRLKFFYAPTISVSVAATGTGLTLNLYSQYQSQFASPAVKNTSAPSSIPVFTASELNYYITSYDNAVLSNISISDAGVMTYDVISTNPSYCSFINVVFTVK
jgi:hypothetical protein